jgi:haloalkane dehalogenase
MVQITQPSSSCRLRSYSLLVSGVLLAGCSSGSTSTAVTTSVSTAPTTLSPTTISSTTTVAPATTTSAPPAAKTLSLTTVSFTTKAGKVSVAKLANGTPPPAPAGSTPFTVDFKGHTIRGIDIAGPGPAIVLLHGFPDNLHLYDDLYPYLAGKRRVIAFDFIGWGASDKPLPGDFDYTMATHQAEIEAVLDTLKLDQIELVLHDASGIPGIDYVLAHPERVARLVLLNTFYGLSPTQSPPYAINMYAAAGLQATEQAINLDPAALEGLYRYQIGLFLAGNPNAATGVDRLWSQFPEALPAFVALNDVLFDEVRQRTIGFGRLSELALPVEIVFGAKDGNLNATVAKDLGSKIAGAKVTIVETAGHFVQMDAPEIVAQRIVGN